MPQRFLRPGIRTSERWNSVSFAAQSLYVRLLTLVDDYGRYDGRASVLWGECFAVWNEQNPDVSVNLQQVEEMLQQLAAKELIHRYENGRKVVQIVQWQERVREGCVSKWPAFGELAATCSDLLLPSPPPSPCTIASTPSPLHLRIGGWFRRKSSTAWSEKELKALKVVEKAETSSEDIGVLEAYYTAEFPADKDYRRRDIITLLNNWPGEIDRAKRWKLETQPHRTNKAGGNF